MTAGSARRRAVVVLLGLVSILVVACGITPEDSASELTADQVPFELLDPSRTGGDLPTDVGGVGEIYLVADDVLLSVPRPIARDADLSTVVDLLATGPTRNEAAIGLRSALPRDPTILSVSQTRNTATVDLDPAFTEIRAAEQPVAIAQIVFTLTRRPEVGRVAFTLEGDPVEVPRGDGSLTTEALTRSDFPELSPGDSPPISTTTSTSEPASTTTAPAPPTAEPGG